jgi:Flp pilus assembly protein TadG
MLMWQNLLKKIASFRRDDRGIQLAELAIVLPIMLVMFGAVAEFGRYFQTYTTLAKGSRVAARYLATACAFGEDDAKAKNLVVYGNEAGTGTPVVEGLSTANINIVRRNSGGGVTSGFPMTITVEIVNFQHTPIFDLGALMKSSTFSLAINVKPSVTMRYLLTQSPACGA